MPIEPLSLLFEFPLLKLLNVGADKLLERKRLENRESMEKIFIDSFLMALKQLDKKYKKGIAPFRKDVQNDKEKLLKLFVEHIDNRDPAAFLNNIQTADYRTTVAAGIVKAFNLENNFKEVLISIVEESLKNYSKSFSLMMSTEEGVQFLVHQSVGNSGKLDRIFESMKQSNKDIEELRLKLLEILDREQGGTSWPTSLDPARNCKNPYLLDSECEISLPSLSDIIKNNYFLDEDGNRHINVAFVYGSGRHPEGDGFFGAVSDALFTPEISALLVNKFRDHQVQIESFLDIDIWERINSTSHKRDQPYRPHLIACGTGDINIITAKTIEYYKKMGYPLRPGPKTPNSDTIQGLSGKTYTSTNRGYGGDVGCLIAVRSPWWEDRLVIVCGGIFAIDTVGTLKLLYYYLQGDTNGFGNNKINPKISGKLIKCHPREYIIELINPDVMSTPHDIRNVKELLPDMIIE